MFTEQRKVAKNASVARRAASAVKRYKAVAAAVAAAANPPINKSI